MTQSSFKLNEFLKRAQQRYHDKGDSQLSDSQYDTLLDALQRHEVLAQIVETGSASQTVGGSPGKVAHASPMLSLDKIRDNKQLSKFLARCGECVAEPKVDGLTLVARYRDGALVQVLTRGDGHHGEDVTEQVFGTPGMPTSISWAEALEVRGEAYFERGQGGNLRNQAVGAVMQTGARDERLRFVAHDYEITQNWYTAVKWLADQGFAVLEGARVKTVEECLAYFESLEAQRGSLPFEADGVVYKANDWLDRLELGCSRKSPKWAAAYKFAGPSATTTIKDISYQVGRTGNITPVAELEPVRLDSALVSRVTLHNLNHLKEQDYRVGDKVIITRSGGVIPAITQVCKRTHRLPITTIPDLCPGCLSKLKDGQCLLGWTCDAQRKARLLHFARSIGRKGVGEKQISKEYHDSGKVWPGHWLGDSKPKPSQLLIGLGVKPTSVKGELLLGFGDWLKRSDLPEGAKLSLSEALPESYFA